MKKANQLIGIVLLLIPITANAIIFNYTILTDPKEHQQIYFLSDYHVDTSNLKKTLTQIDDLRFFIGSLGQSKEIIVEDKISLVSTRKGLLDPAAWIFPFFENLPADKWPIKGDPELFAASPFMWILSWISAEKIPFFNAEYRDTLTTVKQSLTELNRYNDTAPLNAFYQKIYKAFSAKINQPSFNLEKFLSTNPEEADLLLEARIIHCIYQNKRSKYIVVIAGGDHVDSVINELLKIGYKKMVYKGVSNEQSKIYWKEMIETVVKIHFKELLKTQEKVKKIGSVYQKFVDMMALDILTIPRPKEAQKPTRSTQPRSRL